MFLIGGCFLNPRTRRSSVQGVDREGKAGVGVEPRFQVQGVDTWTHRWLLAPGSS